MLGLRGIPRRRAVGCAVVTVLALTPAGVLWARLPSNGPPTAAAPSAVRPTASAHPAVPVQLPDPESPAPPRLVEHPAGPPSTLAAGGLVAAVDADGSSALLRDADGGLLTSFHPDLSWFGRPAATARTVTSGRGWIRVESSDASGIVDVVTLRGTALGIVVESSARPPTSGPVAFLSDGRTGLDLSGTVDGYTPDGDGGSTRRPAIGSRGWRPLTPPPLDLELRFGSTWVGIGLVDVPAAPSMAIDPVGGVRVDYPAVTRALDLGAGIGPDELVRFPRLVLTRASSPLDDLGVYHRALTRLGTAPEATRAGPDWWREPICDTWGQQVVDGVVRDSGGFGTAWVTSFIAGCRARLGTTQFTLVIDARWQDSLGDATPRTTFGGAAGMRALVDAMHAAGSHVLLWWPLWVVGSYSGNPPGVATPSFAKVPTLDPSSPAFAADIGKRMDLALGACDGCLDADGLKVDWEYEIPSGHAGADGVLALYRYLDALHRGALAAKAEALVDASSPAPQFLAVTDAIRLNDVSRPAQWDARARMVAAADPGSLVDADGWTARSDTGPRHLLDAAVYGIAALYSVTTWADGRSLGAPALAGLPDVLELSGRRATDGTATEDAHGLWTWRGPDGARLVELSDRALLWIPASACGALGSGFLAALQTTSVSLPAYVTAPSGRVQAVRAGTIVSLPLRAEC